MAQEQQQQQQMQQQGGGGGGQAAEAARRREATGTAISHEKQPSVLTFAEIRRLWRLRRPEKRLEDSQPPCCPGRHERAATAGSDAAGPA